MDRVSAGYRGVVVLDSVSLTVDQGQILTLLGANGAGKTTALRTAAGVIRPRSGTIRMNGADITRRSPTRRVKSGIVHVPEGRQLFPNLTVRENLALGAYRARSDSKSRMEETITLFPVLGQRSDQLAGSLSGGEAQMLAVARALMGNPRFLLLDEPSLGLAPIVVDRLFAALRALRASGIGVILAEQHAMRALELADTAVVLQRGRVIIEGTASAVLASGDFERGYLGAETSV